MKNSKNILKAEVEGSVIAANQSTPLSLTNDHCYIKINASFKELVGGDLKDLNNLPTFYNITERGLKKAWHVMVEQFNDTMTMRDAMKVFTSNGIRCRSYCAMD